MSAHSYDRLKDLEAMYLHSSWDRAQHRASAQSRFNVDLMQVLLVIARDLRRFHTEKMEKPPVRGGEGFDEH